MNELIGYKYARLISPQYALITDLAIPPFDEPPKIILWGNRAFLRIGEGEMIYLETTSYAAPFEEED